MPHLDELLDADARAWQRDIDARARRFVEPEPTRRLRTAFWSAAAVAAVSAVAVAVVVTINDPAEVRGGSEVSAGANALCVGPILTVTPKTVARGGSVTVRGQWFADGCNDTSATHPVHPRAEVPILLVDGDTVRRLATAHPSGDRYSFTLTVTIPADAPPGRATIDHTRQVDANPLSGNVIRIVR